MKVYSKPRLKVGETAHLLYGEDFETVSILDFNNVEIWKGTIKDLKTKDDPKLDSIREELVRELCEDCFKEKIILLEESENPELRTINDFPKKDIYVVDLLHYLTEHDIIILTDLDSNTLWSGRVEDLIWTKDGCLHDLATRQINWFEGLKDGSICIYLEPENSDTFNIPESKIDHSLTPDKTYLNALNCCRFCRSYQGELTDDAAQCASMNVLKRCGTPSMECPFFKQDLDRVKAWIEELDSLAATRNTPIITASQRRSIHRNRS